MSEIENVLWRLRWFFEVKTDKELAQAMKIPYKTLIGWKTRKSIPEKKVRDIIGPDLVNFEWLFTGKGSWQNTSANMSNNTNSVVVNGSNSGSINNGAMQISSELMEFVELFKEYGNARLLQNFKDELLKIKEIIG